jgi:hypothetical protein
MDNIVVNYLKFIEPKLSESSKFYDKLNESVYQTDLYKFAYKDITIDNFNTKYTNIFYNSLSKLFYGESGNPIEPQYGPGYENRKAKFEKTKAIFQISWTFTKYAVDKLLQDNSTNFPKTILGEITGLQYKLASDFKSPDDVFNKLQNNDMSGFPQELKSKIDKILIDKNKLKEFAISIYTTITDSNKENFKKQILSQSLGQKITNITDEYKKYFPNLSNYSDLDSEIKNIFSSIYIDCYLYVLANSIFNSQKDVVAKTKVEPKTGETAGVKSTKKVSKAGYGKSQPEKTVSSSEIRSTFGKAGF